MYSLVNAPVLAFDLVRRDEGVQVAQLLLEAMTLQAEDLPIVAAAALAPDEQRDEAWMAVAVAEERSQDVQALIADIHASAERQDDAARLSLRDLESGALNTLDALLRFVRTDVLDWTWRRIPDGTGTLAVQEHLAHAASGVVCDALAGCYLRAELHDATRCVLTGPWACARRELPSRSPYLGPCGKDVVHLIQKLRCAGPEELAGLGEAAARARVEGRVWGSALHDASWAAYLSGRTRPAAAAQLLAVEAVRCAGVDVAGLAGGIWNLVSGAVHSTVITDVVAHDTWQALVPPVLAALD